MRLFQIDYKRLVVVLLPTFLRQPRLVAFGTGMTASVLKLYDRFGENRERNLRRLEYNGQVCYLQKLLNDELDRDGGRRIRIADAAGNTWLLAREEANPEQLMATETTLVYNEAAITSHTNIFTVTVPWLAAEVNKTNQLRDFLNEYKLAGSRYKIVFYE